MNGDGNCGMDLIRNLCRRPGVEGISPADRNKQQITVNPHAFQLRVRITGHIDGPAGESKTVSQPAASLRMKRLQRIISGNPLDPDSAVIHTLTRAYEMYSAQADPGLRKILFHPDWSHKLGSRLQYLIDRLRRKMIIMAVRHSNQISVRGSARETVGVHINNYAIILNPNTAVVRNRASIQ